MSNLNVNPQEGRILQATETPVASNVGNKVARPIETAKMARGTMGDFQGEMDAAKVQAQTAQQVNAMVQDASTRLTNLQIAEEESKKQLYQQEWHVREKDARSYAREQAVQQGLDTDGEQQLYLQERDKRTGELKSKYNFVTRVGNDIDQRVELWGDSANADYTERVVVPRRVDNVKAGQIQALEGWNKALADSIASETDPNKVGEILKQNKDAVYNYVRSPQFVATWGAAAAEDVARKYVSTMQTDSITTLTNNDPKMAVALLRNQTGDPATDSLHELDPSLRHTMLYQAEKELSSRNAEAKAALKEEQDAREAELSMAIVTGQLSGNRGIATLWKEYQEKRIDQSHFERGITRLQMEADRRERRAQAATDRAQRAADKREALLAPARDAIEMGLPLDPRNPSHVKSANAYAEAAIAQNPKSNQIDVLLNVTQVTGVAPRILTSKIHSLVNSKDPKEAVQGAQLLAKVGEKAPNVVHSINDETVSKANQIALGVHPEQAQANIERMRTLTKEQKDKYKEIGSKALPKLETELKNSFGISKKEITPEAYGHARDLFQDQLILAGGNVEAAMESTKALMRKNYGVSYLTGSPTLMFNAPEGASGKVDWMTKQFADDLKGIGLKPEQVRLKSNGDGSYDLFAINQYGVVTGQVVDPKSGAKLTWEPDQSLAAKQQRDALLADAQKKRDAFLSSTPNPILNPQPVDATDFVPKGMRGKKPVNTDEQLSFGKFKSESK